MKYWHRHHWHEVPDSKRKVKINKKIECAEAAKDDDNYYRWGGTSYGALAVRWSYYCCLCPKTRSIIVKDCSGKDYPPEEES